MINFGDFKMIEILNIEYFVLLIDIIHFCIPFPPFNDTHWAAYLSSVIVIMSLEAN